MHILDLALYLNLHLYSFAFKFNQTVFLHKFFKSFIEFISYNKTSTMKIYILLFMHECNWKKKNNLEISMITFQDHNFKCNDVLTFFLSEKSKNISSNRKINKFNNETLTFFITLNPYIWTCAYFNHDHLNMYWCVLWSRIINLLWTFWNNDFNYYIWYFLLCFELMMCMIIFRNM
jgi:hypothetical protein